jgi:hypothetical protein
MRSAVACPALIACAILAGCTGSPVPLELDAARRREVVAAEGWVVPHAAAPSQPHAEVEGEGEIEVEEGDEPTLDGRAVRPRLAFRYDAEERDEGACAFWVDFIDAPAVSTDGAWIVHDRVDRQWTSDGGESWEDYYDEEPLDAVEVVLARTDGAAHEVLRIVDPGEVPHRADGHLHCRKLMPLMRAGVRRINARLRDHAWRPMHTADELGIRVIETADDLGTLASSDADRTALELFMHGGAFVLRRKGVEVIHRSPSGWTRHGDCNMQPSLGGVELELNSGLVLVSVAERCVCFGDESDQHFTFVISERARTQVAALAEAGRAIRDAESW